MRWRDRTFHGRRCTGRIEKGASFLYRLCDARDTKEDTGGESGGEEVGDMTTDEDARQD